MHPYPLAWDDLILDPWMDPSAHDPFTKMNEGGFIPDTSVPAKAAGSLRNSFLLLGVLVLCTALWFGLRSRSTQFKWDLFAATFAQMQWGWFGASVLLVMTTYLGRAVRWQVMLRPLRPDCTLWNLFNATAIGFTAVVLFGRAGELVRPYLIANKEKVPFSSQLAAWFLERIYDLLAVLLLFGFALTRVSASSTKVSSPMQWILQAGGSIVAVMGAVCLILLLALGLYPTIVEKRLIDALGFLPQRFRVKVEGLVKAFLSGTTSTQRGSFVFRLVFYTFCEWMIIVACFLCLFQAFPQTRGLVWVDTLIVVGFVAFGSAVQIPGVGGGMQVATVLVLTELFLIPLEVATGIAILLWIVTFVIVVPVGLVLAVKDGLKWRKLMQTEEIQSQ
ncbi:MAG TPA: lysylphosphatidylglycerol synthase transmembrane domain-containing protein [Bryobacteraceae bacterium]|nr:lysylphosphatidylglycerol synthase transmembrane domain-containing protein [Bryobacteraceae bacterium]